MYVSSFTLIPILSSYSLILTIYLCIRHGIDSPREPEDLFLFARNPSLVTFEAVYPVDSPASIKTIRCLQCSEGKLSERHRLFDINGVKDHISAK